MTDHVVNGNEISAHPVHQRNRLGAIGGQLDVIDHLAVVHLHGDEALHMTHVFAERIFREGEERQGPDDTGTDAFSTEPFSGSAEELVRKHVHELPVPVRQEVPALDMELASCIDRMLAKSPDDRQQSWQDIHDTLQKIYHRIKSGNASSVPPSGKRKESGFPQWLKMLLAIAAVILGIVVVIRVFQ